MKEIIKQEKGVTMIALIATIIILFFLTGMLVYNAQDSVEIKALNNLYNDIGLLKSKISEYYNEYGEIPAKIQYTKTDTLSSVLSEKNDVGNFYVIDLEAIQGITLNYGKDYEKIKNDSQNANNYTDIYIINENSHNIFYVQGITITQDNSTNTYYTDYTEPDETTVDLRYIDGILIPEGYYYIGKEKDDRGNESIVISTNKDEKVNSTSLNQYVWQKQISNIEEVPSSIILTNQQVSTFQTIQASNTLEDEQIKNSFLKSVNHYKGYFKNKNKTSNIDAIYLPIEENKWSEKYTKNEKYVDKNGDIAYIPEGFRVSLAEGTNEIRSGLVITDEIDENNQSIGNEFVWIPVDEFGEFIREDFGTSNINKEDFVTTSAMEGKYYEPSGDGDEVDETANENIKEAQELYKSVKEYKGFYIGRYETGIQLDTQRTSQSGATQDAVIKKNKYVYNYIAWGNSISDERGGAVQIARNMYENSTLCYGVQWDAIMRWINKDTSMKYIIQDSTENGNYHQSGNLIKTGNDEKYQIKNIYDIAGNVAEWTMESSGLQQKVLRGGKSGSTDSITNREVSDVDNNSGVYGFRVALYIN